MKINIKDYEVDVDVIDNNSNKTLLCIHGFNSNKDFIKNLGKEKAHFNIVSYTVPEQEKMTVDFMEEIALMILKRIKNSQVYLLGHSLGGAVVSRIVSNRIKGCFYVSSIHPFLARTNQYKTLKIAVMPKTKSQMVLGKLATRAARASNKGSVFVDETLPWFNVVKGEILNPDFMSRLDEDMKKSINPTYIVGDKDMIISTKDFKEYVQEELHETIIVVKGQHNPFANPAVQKTINSEIEFKNR